jgi:hypothetical protein
MEVLPAPGLKSKSAWLMELRLALSLFYMYTKDIDPNVLVFRG